MPFPTPMPGYRTQYETRSDAPRYGVRPVGCGLAAALAVPIAVPIAVVVGVVGWLVLRCLHALFC